MPNCGESSRRSIQASEAESSASVAAGNEVPAPSASRAPSPLPQVLQVAPAIAQNPVGQRNSRRAGNVKGLSAELVSDNTDLEAAHYVRGQISWRFSF